MITVPLDYEDGIRKIPNALTKNAGEPYNKVLLDCIELGEKELLSKVLGEAQYLVLESELLKLPFKTGESETAGQIWQDLVNGKGSFTGLKNICMNYVYCKYLKETEIRLSTTGSGKPKVKNHSVTDYNQKYVERWNEFVCWVGDMGTFLNDTDGLERRYDYPCYELENQFGL